MNGLVHEIGLIGCEIVQRYPMNRYTSLRVGGIADLVVSPSNIEEFKKLLDLLSASGVPWVVLGAGSNTLVYDAGIEGVVVALDRQERSHGDLSAIQEVEQRHGIPVLSIINLDQIITCITGINDMNDALLRIQSYRGQYGV